MGREMNDSQEYDEGQQLKEQNEAEKRSDRGRQMISRKGRDQRTVQHSAAKHNSAHNRKGEDTHPHLSTPSAAVLSLIATTSHWNRRSYVSLANASLPSEAWSIERLTSISCSLVTMRLTVVFL
jgi:hypothetical protein